MSKITVFQLPGAWGLPTISPFCLKLGAWLRIAGIPHDLVTVAAPFGGPKGKAPWATIDGVRLGDSDFIIQRLKALYGVDPNRDLSPLDMARARGLQHILEDSLWWCLNYDRWTVGANWRHFRAVILSLTPVLVRPLAAPIIRERIRAQIRAQGMGRHTPAEMLDIATRDLTALSDSLGDRPWFMGEAPTDIDAAAYGLLANIVRSDIDSPLRTTTLGFPRLTGFVDRFEARYYS